MIDAPHPAHPPVPPHAAAPLPIAIDDRGFSPARAVVAPGAILRWANGGRQRHTVTATDGSFDSGALGFGGRFTIIAPRESGVVDYVCDFHAFMRGTITVSDIVLDGPAAVPVGSGVSLTGTVPGAADGSTVVIERRVPGAWERAGSTRADGAGAYAVRLGPLRARTAVRAVAGTRVSPALRIAVLPRLSVRRAGSRVALAAGRASAGAGVRLERLDLDTYRWRATTRHRLSPAGTVTVRLGAAGVYRFVVGPSRTRAGASSDPIVHRPYRLRLP